MGDLLPARTCVQARTHPLGRSSMFRSSDCPQKGRSSRSRPSPFNGKPEPRFTCMHRQRLFTELARACARLSARPQPMVALGGDALSAPSKRPRAVYPDSLTSRRCLRLRWTRVDFDGRRGRPAHQLANVCRSVGEARVACPRRSRAAPSVRCCLGDPIDDALSARQRAAPAMVHARQPRSDVDVLIVGAGRASTRPER